MNLVDTAYQVFVCFDSADDTPRRSQHTDNWRHKSRRAARNLYSPSKWDAKGSYNSMAFIVKIRLKKPGLIPDFAPNDKVKRGNRAANKGKIK